MVARVVLSESACDEHAAKTLAGRSEVLMTLLVPVAVVAHYYAAAESAAGSFVVVVVVAVVVGSENYVRQCFLHEVYRIAHNFRKAPRVVDKDRRHFVFLADIHP